MPIYEFYCPDCHTIFNFLSRSVNTSKRPLCPRCKKVKLTRELSMFSTASKGEDAPGGDETGDLPFDEAKMEKAMTQLAGEAEKMSEDDPRQAAGLMRKFSDMTGMRMGENMETAIQRMESGEDPEVIEKEMGHLLENEEPVFEPDPAGGPGGKKARSRRGPERDDMLYDL